jgi:hypothetical protein
LRPSPRAHSDDKPGDRTNTVPWVPDDSSMNPNLYRARRPNAAALDGGADFYTITDIYPRPVICFDYADALVSKVTP